VQTGPQRSSIPGRQPLFAKNALGWVISKMSRMAHYGQCAECSARIKFPDGNDSPNS
jgi:hypothetical protein